MPPEANASSPGLALAAAISSATDLKGCPAPTTSRWGMVPSVMTGAKDWIGS